MIIVSDTSALFYLAQIDYTHLLSNLFQEVIIPEAVADELAKVRHHLYVQQLLRQPWLRIQAADNKLLVHKMANTCSAEFEAKTPYFYSTFEG